MRIIQSTHSVQHNYAKYYAGFYASWSSSNNASNKIYLYRGTPPANTKEFFVNGYNSYSGDLVCQLSNYRMGDNSNSSFFDITPPSGTALIDGPITWAIMWYSVTSDNFLMCSVGDGTSNHALTLNNVNVTAGDPVDVIGFYLKYQNEIAE